MREWEARKNDRHRHHQVNHPISFGLSAKWERSDEQHFVSKRDRDREAQEEFFNEMDSQF